MEDHQQGTDPSHSAQAMEQQQQQWKGYFGPYSAQPYDQYKGQNNALPTVPVETQQHDNVFRNSAAQLQLEEQENVHWRKQQVIDFLMNEDFNELYEGIVGSLTDKELIQQYLGDEIYQEIESEMSNFGNEEWAQQLGQNTPEEEAELMAGLKNCETFDSLLDFFCPINNVF
ncbi:hypothetical protein N665_0017s0109 [Sinapis alba]|nr:hypothetical protein N665_0017s0109 [Sinapis alba]